MPKKGWKSLTLREETMNKLQKMWQTDLSRPRSQTFTSYVEDFLTSLVEREDRLRKYGFFMRFEGAGESHVTIFDNTKRKSVTVRIDSKGKALYCLEDDSSTCIHVGFCYAIDQVLKTLIAKGFKLPKESS